MNYAKMISVAMASITLANPVLAQENHPAGHGDQGHSRDHMAGMHGNREAAKAPFDQQFLDTMSMHHQHGIEMAELVDSRAAHDELKTLAKK